ncbi:hypothetical protein GGI24_001913 [Coemansia furcata]|nr:hypothetical protein GGI24_001913 [Coemansia furcata]
MQIDVQPAIIGSIIGLLPALEELATMTAVVGEALVPPEELPVYVLRAYGCVDRRQFRCWRPGYYLPFDMELVTCVLLLGLACTDFYYVVGGAGDGQQWLQRMVKYKLEEEPGVQTVCAAAEEYKDQVI